MREWTWLFAGLALIAVFTSCTRFRTLKKEVTRLEDSYYLSGQLSHESATTESVWVFVWERYEDGVITVTDIARLNSGGKFVFMLPPGNHYHVGALEDTNGNEQYDPGERLWIHGKPSPVEFTDGRAEGLRIKLSKTINISEEDALALSTAHKGRSYLEMKGAGHIPVFIDLVTDLSNPMFSEEFSRKGLWEPATFLNEIGLGVCFFQEYDPVKIPVLFVHGVGGSPRHWKYISEHLDDRSFQKWFYYYPTGVRLEDSSRALNRIVEALQEEYGFKQLYVVGHSMGGLVSKSFILTNLANKENRYIKKLITIATPWNGHEAAAIGVKRAPAAIPSWIDMQVDSPFLNTLLSRPIRDQVDYYLLFAFQGRRSTFLPTSNDGTVSLASQLAPRAQQDARMRYGFDLDHMEVMNNKSVVQLLERVLKE